MSNKNFKRGEVENMSKETLVDMVMCMQAELHTCYSVLEHRQNRIDLLKDSVDDNNNAIQGYKALVSHKIKQAQKLNAEDKVYHDQYPLDDIGYGNFMYSLGYCNGMKCIQADFNDIVG